MFLVLKLTHPESYARSIILETDHNGELDHIEDYLPYFPRDEMRLLVRTSFD